MPEFMKVGKSWFNPKKIVRIYDEGTSIAITDTGYGVCAFRDPSEIAEARAYLEAHTWKPEQLKTLDQLVAEQGIHGPQDINGIKGVFADEPLLTGSADEDDGNNELKRGPMPCPTIIQTTPFPQPPIPNPEPTREELIRAARMTDPPEGYEVNIFANERIRLSKIGSLFYSAIVGGLPIYPHANDPHGKQWLSAVQALAKQCARKRG